MSNSYAKRLPIDQSGTPMQEYPAPFPATKTYQTENGVNSSVISLRDSTTTIEVGAFGGQGAVIRWIPSTETAGVSPFASVIASGAGANFDHYVPPSTFRRFVVPKDTQGQGTGALSVASTYGLYGRVARINAGTTASSVLVIEY